jgi:dephospho-CoA kinase
VLIVGLTGNVASGKTTVAERWRERGATVIDADRLGHEVLREDRAVRDRLVEAFGPEILGAEGEVRRGILGERAFASPEATRQLNAIVHPPLLARLEQRLDRARGAGREIVVVDAALIFEFGLDHDMDVNVLVTAPRATRAGRLRGRGLDDERIERIMASQLPDAEKAPACDFVIDNEGSVEDLLARADEVLEAIRSGREPTNRGGRDG